MYVCICNAVTDDDVHDHMANGCTTAKAVKAACGFKPGCGMCTKRIHTMVSEYRTASELADALTGGAATLTPVAETPVFEGGLPETAAPQTTAPQTAGVAQPAGPETTEGGAAPRTAA